MSYQPKIIKSGNTPSPTQEVEVFDEYGERMVKEIACERPITVMLNWKEIVTLMTLGSRPEALVLGYLKTKALLKILLPLSLSLLIGKLVQQP